MIMDLQFFSHHKGVGRLPTAGTQLVGGSVPRRLTGQSLRPVQLSTGNGEPTSTQARTLVGGAMIPSSQPLMALLSLNALAVISGRFPFTQWLNKLS